MPRCRRRKRRPFNPLRRVVVVGRALTLQPHNRSRPTHSHTRTCECGARADRSTMRDRLRVFPCSFSHTRTTILTECCETHVARAIRNERTETRTRKLAQQLAAFWADTIMFQLAVASLVERYSRRTITAKDSTTAHINAAPWNALTHVFTAPRPWHTHVNTWLRVHRTAYLNSAAPSQRVIPRQSLRPAVLSQIATHPSAANR